jgi:16S rRNA (uracil1498-N3)-methyltransferase
MARRRFFVPEVAGSRAELSGEEAKHLTHVLRVETGQVYEISDNDGVYVAEVELARKQHVVFRVLERLPPEPEPVPVTLLLSLIKFERLETAIEKATELGVHSIQLVRSERSEKGLDIAAPKRLGRWQRIAQEAAQQSRRTRLPDIQLPVPFRSALHREAAYRLFLDEERTGQALLHVIGAPAPAAILIGPEGGWPDHEREAARQAGWTPISLGPTVLRTETAAAAALAVVNAAFARSPAPGRSPTSA